MSVFPQKKTLFVCAKSLTKYYLLTLFSNTFAILGKVNYTITLFKLFLVFLKVIDRKLQIIFMVLIAFILGHVPLERSKIRCLLIK